MQGTPSNPRRTPGVIAVAIACLVLIIAFLALFVASSLEMSLGDGLVRVAGTLWGVTTLADLGVGLLFIAVWIALLERSSLRAAPWIVAIFLLGNFTTLVYLLVRCRQAETLHALFLEPRQSPRPAPAT